MHRINYLDGHRGIAILLVISFHAFARWPELVPYSNQFSEFPFFKYGYIGVQLFFLISGFVILMTLEKCKSFNEFIYRRWLRLFPAMLICSLIVFFTCDFFYERPHGQPGVLDLIPGLTFIEPYILQKITGIPFKSMEGAFWSLYVEFKFYIIAAIIYFLCGSRNLVLILFLCLLSWLFLDQLHDISDNRFIYYASGLFTILDFEHFGWFSAGGAYYLFSTTKEKKWFYIGLFVSLVNSIALSKFDPGIFFAAVSISFFFAFSHINSKLQKMISAKFLLFFGFVSYPLYLIHENIMISSIIKFDNYIPMVANYLYPLISITLLSIIAYIIAKYIEKPVKKLIMISTSKLLKYRPIDRGVSLRKKHDDIQESSNRN